MAEKVMDCPFCNKPGHLYLNLEKQVYYCFRCGAKGKAGELERQGVWTRSKEDLLKPVTLSFRVSEALSDPPEYYPLTTSSGEYLTGRGIHGSIINTLRKKIYETPKGLLFFYPDEDYWQVRHWSAWAPPRWVNPSTAPRTPSDGVVYHLRTHYDSGRVVLVEGIVDALRVAPFENAAAVLSANVHEAQVEKLRRTYDEAVLMLDGDVPLSKQLEQYRKLGAHFSRTLLTACPAADPGSATDRDLERILDELLYGRRDGSGAPL